jgi:hypothetical protein
MKGNPAGPGGQLTSKPTWSNTQGCSIMSAFYFGGLEAVLRLTCPGPMNLGGPGTEDSSMNSQVVAITVAVSVAVLMGLALLWYRMRVYQWYCRRCKKIVSAGRFHPGKCACGAGSLVAYFCKSCASWHTSPTTAWHCLDCSSKNVVLGAEWHRFTALWKWRNQGA